MTPPPPVTRLTLLSPEVAVAVDPERLRVLVVAGYSPELAPLVKPDRRATARALWARQVHPHLADLLEMLARLATPAGRDALVEAARDRGRDHAGWSDESPADLAADLLARSIEEHGVLQRAHLRLSRLPIERPTYELRSKGARRIAEAPPATSRSRSARPGRLDALAAALRDVRGPGAGPARRGGPTADAWVYEEEATGDVHAVVLHEAPGTPPRADAFRFRVSEGRLAVTASRPQWLEAYAAAWGAALYDDAAFFLDTPSVTLKPLQELGSAGLAAATERRKLVSDVPRVRVLACRLEAGDGHRIETHGPDALARIAPHLRDGGHLTRAIVRVHVAGEAGAVDCVLQPPHRVDVGWGGVAGSGARGPRVAREAIVRLGLLSPGTLADDVTTMRPLLQPEWRWQELVGDAGWTAMCQAGLLEEVEASATRRAAAPAFRRFGRAAVAFPLFKPAAAYVEGRTAVVDPDLPEHVRNFVRAIHDVTEYLVERTDYYVVPDDPALPAATVPQKQMVMQRLSLGALLRKARREMGLRRGERPRLPRGVLWIGEMPVEGGVVRFVYVVRAATDDKDRAALGRAITRAAGFGRAVVLVPKGRRLGRDFVEIELTVKEQLGAESWRGKVADAVRALGIEDKVEPERLAPGDARLVVDTKRQRVLLDGVPLVRLSENGYKLLRVLAERNAVADMVPTRETDKAISGARETPGATRYTAFKMRGWLESSFADAGSEVPRDVKEEGLVRAVGRKGWRLTVRAVVT
ncbi:MAG TPA: hypothetical protein VGG39_37165 [Polyangiaceae bacterium]|jgi:hypothetical protein